MEIYEIKEYPSSCSSSNEFLLVFRTFFVEEGLPYLNNMMHLNSGDNF